MKITRQLFFTLSALFILTNCHAQWGNKIKGNGDVVTIERNTSDYDEIKLAGSMNFELVNGKEGNISITGESNILDYIITETKGDVLVVKFKNNSNVSYKSEPIKIVIPFEDISYVSLAGSGNVRNNATITSQNFKTKVSGSGDMILNIEAKNVEASVTGSGDLTLKGNSANFDASVTGSGDINAKKLDSKKAEVKVTGSGSIDLYVVQDLKAKIVGSGDINYYGNPANTNNKVVGSGDITKK